jgi:hypothetical protein
MEYRNHSYGHATQGHCKVCGAVPYEACGTNPALLCPTCKYPKATGNGSWLVSDAKGRPLYYHPCPDCTTDPERLAWLRRVESP